MTVEEIRSYIELIIDPSRGRSLKELDAIKYIGINEEKDSIVLIVEIGKRGGQAEEFLKRELARVVKIGLGFSGIKIQLEECKDNNYIAGKNTKYFLISSSKNPNRLNPSVSVKLEEDENSLVNLFISV